MSVAEIAATVALVAGGFTVGLIAILHVLEPEYDPSWRMISEYSLGRHGWVMRFAFVTMAIGLSATGVALWPFGGAWAIGLAAVALGALGAAFIDADPIMTPRADATPVGRAHTVLGVVLLAGFPPAALLAGVGVGPALGWTLVICSVVPLAGLVWFLIAAAPAHGQGGSPKIRIGWPDRFCLLAYLAWVVLAAISVLSVL
ncbi:MULTISPECIES: DUF998 domain-containing protein [unclassified Microbacterium]|uniref:DUF998 domain-containing protein n=1 Tax=unclassified Microbacterium TaxID=2609290 RepID=UPI00214B4A2D|nr:MULTISPECIES: DUF998 domain-containing protein [unclassified Microbacterium]MCR2809928.1 DUF998 domain-containing protein [Microbacterium sp. zg.B185]WIM17766.1 DUF998 domain-containing protein [Microbacterium sp. zg-B185]